MNKEALAQAVANRTGMPKGAALESIDAVFESIREALISHEAVNIPGFGKFEAPYKASRVARNPATGGTVSVPAHHGVKFAPAKALKDAVH